MDTAQYNKGKGFESSVRKEVNKMGLNSKKGNQKELVDRKRVLAGKVEGLYIGKVQETFKKEGKQSVKKGGLSKAVWKLMKRGVNWEDECEQGEGLLVGELGRSMVADEWAMGEEALLKERRVTGGESMMFEWVSKNSYALELSPIQLCCSYLDSAKCY